MSREDRVETTALQRACLEHAFVDGSPRLSNHHLEAAAADLGDKSLASHLMSER